MSLNLATKELSRKELKSIMAGSGGGCTSNDCYLYVNGTTLKGFCGSLNITQPYCFCVTSYGYYGSTTSNGGTSRCWA